MVDDFAGADVEVADFGVAGFTTGETDGFAGGGKGGFGVGGPVAIEVGGIGKSDGVTGTGGS